jgi:hypothetical protein
MTAKKMIDQESLDIAYWEGKRAYQKSYGTHGPTYRPHTMSPPKNPYQVELLREAWARGWGGDVRRVIAPKRSKK